MGRRLLIAIGLLAACTPAGAAPDATAGLAKRLDGIEDRLGNLDATLTTVDENVAALQESVEALNKKLDEAAAHEHAPPRPHTHAPPHTAPSTTIPVPPWREGIEDIKCEDGTCHIERSVIEALFAEPAKLARQARVVPSQKDGKTVGYKLYGIRARSLPSALGIKNGDLLTHVNGDAWTSIDDAMEGAMGLKTAKKITLDLDRRGTSMTLVIIIDDA